MGDQDSQYVKVQRSIWNKPAFKGLSEDGKTLFLYVITSPHSNMLGYYVLPPGYACEDLGWLRERFTKGLRELLAKHLIAVDFDTNVILDLHQIVKYPPENPNQVKAAISKFNEIPKNSLYQQFENLLERLDKPFIKPLHERLHERFAKPETETETETEEETEEKTLAPNDEKPSLGPIPKNGKINYSFETHSWENIPDDLKLTWAKLCPALNIDSSLNDMALWLEGHPQNRKSDYKKFITNWLKREQDRARPVKKPDDPLAAFRN
jgi:hypothetical protein